MATARIEQERKARRRRDDGTLDRIHRLTLHIPDEIQEKYGETHKFRWTNDEGNRMYAKTQLDDWDKVGEVPPIPVGTDVTGKPVYAHLCIKPKEFCEEDARKKHQELLEMEKGLLQGNRDAASKVDLPETAYVPEGTKNAITRGVHRPT